MVSAFQAPALAGWRKAEGQGERFLPSLFSSDVYDEHTVREVLLSTGYPAERIRIVKGEVEQTIPRQAPEELALLRLDTDWYASTAHELEHLYPRVGDGGVLIIDDYGHWEGARRAVDEYFEGAEDPILLNRIDYSGRIGVKA